MASAKEWAQFERDVAHTDLCLAQKALDKAQQEYDRRVRELEAIRASAPPPERPHSQDGVS